MKIFLTGATGYLCSALARGFMKDGHDVLGLTRRPEKAEQLARAGMWVVHGDLRAPETWWRAARESQVLIHAGFEYGPDAWETDLTATHALVDCATAAALDSHARTLIYTSGVWVLGPRRDKPVDETARPAPLAAVSCRPDQERLILDAAGGAISTAVIRPG